VAIASAALRGGARLLQIREKHAGSGAFLALADTIVGLARGYDARVIVNDRADIARLASADGVHVGQDDLPVEDARRVAGPSAIVGVSTHTREQVDAALATSASYVAVGPIFATATKDTGYEARGLDLVRYASGRGKPIVAIGGITLERAPAVLDAGASALAVISDILAGDVEARVRAFLARSTGQSALPFKV
jgi:thiamine-phosphate pyrophosphorylase